MTAEERLRAELQGVLEQALADPALSLKAATLFLLFSGVGVSDLLQGNTVSVLSDISAGLRKAGIPQVYSSRLRDQLFTLLDRIAREGVRLRFAGLALEIVDGTPVLGVKLVSDRPIPELLRRALEHVLTIRWNIRTRRGITTVYRRIGIVGDSEIFIPLFLAPVLLGILGSLGSHNFYQLYEACLDVIRKFHEREIYIGKHARLPKLRPYQEEAISKWLESGGRGIIVLPTGTGKTLVALEIIRRVRAPVLVIVPYAALVNRWARELRGRLGLHVVTDLRAPSLRRGAAQAVVVTERGLYEFLKREGLKGLALLNSLLSRGLVIIDEVHHAAAPTYLAVLLSLCPRYVLGLTATPERADRNEYPAYVFLGGIVYRKSYTELAEEGYVAPVLLKPLVVKVEELYRRLKTWLEELRKRYTKPQAVALLAKLSERLEKAVRNLDKLIRRYAEARAEGDIVTARLLENRIRARLRFMKALEAARLAAEYVRSGHRVIVFSARKKPVYLVEEVLEKILEIPTAVLTGERKDLAEIYSGEARVVVATAAGEEGVDLPSFDVLIFVDIPGTKRSLLQRAGRVTRPGIGKVSEIVLLAVTAPGLEEDVVKLRNALRILEEEFPQNVMRRLAEKVIAQARGLAEIVERARRMPRLPLEAYYYGLHILKPYLPWIETWFRDVVRKRPEELTDVDRVLLLLLRFVTEVAIRGYAQSLGTDLAFGGRNRARTVIEWLRDPRRYDLPGVDTPEMRRLYNKMKKALRRGGLPAVVRAALEEIGSEKLIRRLEVLFVT